MHTLTVGNLRKETIAACNMQANFVSNHAGQIGRRRSTEHVGDVQRVPRENLGQGVILSLYCSVGLRCSPQHRPTLNVENA